MKPGGEGPRFPALLGVLAVTVVNAAVLFVAGVLAVNGDGTPGGMYVVWSVGGLLILCFTGVALFRWALGKSSVLVAAAALPFGYVAAVVCMLVPRLLGF